MDEVKWYENCSLESIKNIIKNNINITSRSFVAIGYYLKNVRDRKLYLQDGYKNILEFAEGEFNISESWANKWMRINDRFSKDGNSPILLDEYKGFRSSILAEMITLTDEQLEQVTITTTRAEIRSIKQQAKKEKDLLAPAPVEVVSEDLELETVLTSEQKSSLGYTKSVYPPDSLIESKGCGNKHACFSCSRICQIRQEDRYCVEAPMGYPFPCTTMKVLESIENDIGEGCMFLNLELAPIRSGDKEPVPCCKDCKKKCGYACNKATHAETVIEEQKTVIEKVEAELPCEACGHDINGCCDYPDSPDDYCVMGDKQIPKEEQVETVEADIIQTIQEEDENQEVIDPECYTYQDIRDELNKLIEYVAMYRKNNDAAPGRRKAKMRLDAMVLLDEEMRKPPVLEEPEPVQPELPKLKNNDQRKEWIDNYETWPIWIDIPQTGERYYRYDFDNGTSFVIRVSLQHAYKDYVRTEETEYAHKEYFLLGVKDKWIPGMPTFVESSTNKSAMVEHLKEIQKKGA